MIAATDLKGRSFTKVADWNRDDLETVLDLADELKAARAAGVEHRLLPGRTVGLIFEKPSTRTRVSFGVGIAQLGATPLFFSAGELQIGRGETIRDTATVLSRYLDALVIRTFAQADVEGLAEHATIPVINALSDAAHPCQVLADLQTIRERRGRLDGLKLVYLGDGNNMCASLMVGAATFGVHFVAATPTAYAPPSRAVEIAQERAAASGGSVELTDDPRAAVAAADVLYTDVWTSMGQEAESERRVREFAGFGIDAELVRTAGERAIVLHCLPAHYGEEITEDVVYGPQSAVFDQAENRLHAQKALLALVV
ncbi:MAG: ornithine carbamoyltransferase [Gaiellaceae bacterium]